MFSFATKNRGEIEAVEFGRRHQDQRTMYSRRTRKSQGPRLERRNAVKNIDYDAVASGAASWASTSFDETPELRATRSLDLAPSYSNQTSFRIDGGIEGAVDLICRSLGLSGPDDFAIPAAAWEARKARSSSDLLPRSRLLQSPDSPTFPAPSTSIPTLATPSRLQEEPDLPERRRVEIRAGDDEPAMILRASPRIGVGDGGIRGFRPPILTTPSSIPPPPLKSALSVLPPPPSRSTSAPNPSPSSVLALPPSMSLPVFDKESSTWDIVRSFAPEEESNGLDEEVRMRRSFDSDEEEEEEERDVVSLQGRATEEGEEVRGLTMGETSEDLAGALPMSNDDDSPSSTTEAMFVISPNGRFKRHIKSWMRGQLLGSGSFGTVYEGIGE